MKTKPFWKSKTFWFNAIALANAGLPLLGIPTIPMDNDTTALVLTTGNVLLRTVTNGRMTLSSN